MFKKISFEWLKSHLTTIIEVLVKGAFDVLTVPLVVLLIVSTITKEATTFSLIARITLLGVVHYIFAAGMSHWARYWQLRSVMVVVLRVVSCILAVVVSVSVVLVGQDAIYQISALILVMWIWYRASHFRIEDLPYRETRNYIFYMLVFATFFSYMPWIAKGKMSTEILSFLYPSLLVLGILYLGLVNTHNIFMKAHENQLNQSNNLKRFRKSALLMGVGAWFLVQASVWVLAGKSVLKWLVEGIADVILFILYPIILFLSKISQAMQSKMSAAGKGEGSLSSEAGDLQKIKELEPAVIADWPWLEPLLIAMGLLIACFIFYRLFSKSYGQKYGLIEDSETKSFIFEDAFKFPKRVVKPRFSEKDKVRAKYFHWLKYWYKNGYQIGASETPKTFLKRLTLQATMKEELSTSLDNFEVLTNLYEKVRYGEMHIDGQDVIAFKKIDDRPDK